MKKYTVTSVIITFIAFLAIFSIYLFNLENRFIIKTRITIINLNFPIPVLFFALISLYIFSYAKLLNKNLLKTISLILPLAIFLKFAFFVIEMLGIDPWKGENYVFTIYSHLYLTLIISSCLMIIYKLKNYLKADRSIVIIVGIAFISYLIYKIIRTRSYFYIPSIAITSLFFCFLLKIKGLFKIAPRKRELLFVILVFMLAFAVRFGWGLRVISITGNKFYTASDDGLTYGPYAEDWVKGLGHSPLGQYGGFGYWVFLGLIYKFFGSPNYPAAIFFQSLLGALVAVCIYYIAKSISNPAIAKTSSTLVSLNMNNIFTTVVIGMEALFIPLVFISLFLFIKYISNGKIKFFKYSFLTGILLGITNIVRQELLFLPIIFFLCFVLFAKNRFKLRESFKIISYLTIGFLIILLSYSLRNYIKEGKFDFRTRSAAIGFSGSESGVNETKILSEMGFNPFENLGKSLKVAVKRPLTVSSLLLKGIIKKGFNYLFCANFGALDFLTLFNSSAVGDPLYHLPLYSRFYIYIFILIGLFTLGLDKKYLLEKSILLGYIVYTFLIYAIIYTTNARHRAVLEPLFIILFVSTIYFMLSEFRKAVI